MGLEPMAIAPSNFLSPLEHLSKELQVHAAFIAEGAQWLVH
jgi:hypothetical protein